MANDGGPAYPIPSQAISDGVSMYSTPGCAGMSRRDYFAAQALTGLRSTAGMYVPSDVMARLAVADADALLAALDAPASPGETE